MSIFFLPPPPPPWRQELKYQKAGLTLTMQLEMTLNLPPSHLYLLCSINPVVGTRALCC